MIVSCPRCGKSTDWEGNEFRPFCSMRCKLIDLGSWISEEYVISEAREPMENNETKIEAEEQK